MNEYKLQLLKPINNYYFSNKIYYFFFIKSHYFVAYH